MHLVLAAATKYAPNTSYLQYAPDNSLIRTHSIFQIKIMASLSDKDAVYLHKIACLRSLYLQDSMIPCYCEVLQVICEDKNVHELFAVCPSA